MKTVILKEQASPAEAVRQVEEGGEAVLLVRDGRAVALIVPFDDDDLEWYARERDPAFVASLAEARRQVVDGKTTSHRDLRAKLGLD